MVFIFETISLTVIAFKKHTNYFLTAQFVGLVKTYFKTLSTYRNSMMCSYGNIQKIKKNIYERRIY
jgi:hypothetical protein